MKEQTEGTTTIIDQSPQVRATRPLRPPIAATVAYEFDSLQHCADTYGHKIQSHAYSRLSNPTVEALEQSMSERCGAYKAVAYASGMAAISALYMALARPGKNIVSSSRLYGGTLALQHNLREFGVEFRYVDFSNPGEIESAIDENTVMLFSEPIANPAMSWYDFAAVKELAASYEVLSVLDNTNTIALFDALRWCDIEVDSATKYVGGHGAGIGGLVLCSRIDLSKKRYAHLSKPSGDFGGRNPVSLGADALPGILRGACLRNFGACLSPFNAYLFQLGLDTLDLRMRDISYRTLELARFCHSHPCVGVVLHAEVGPHSAGIEKYFPRGTGGLFSFTLKQQGYEAIQKFFGSLSLIPVATNIGDSRTIVQHVESTSHSQLTQEQLAAAGIPPGLLRVSVGLEPLDKLLKEFSCALSS